MSAPPGSARRRAREVAFRLAYQADVMAEGFDADWSARCAEEHLGPDQSELVGDVLGVLSRRAVEVDEFIQSAARHWELDRLAAKYGQTPWQALHDPHLAFNVSVLRAADQARGMVYGLTMQGAAPGDDMGIGRVLALLTLIYKDH
mgnify:CR=1 FL=1